MFSCVPESELLHGAIVPADEVKRRHNHPELNQIDDEELKRRSIKCIVPKPAYQSVDREPSHYIEKEIQRRRRPFMAEKMRPETNPARNCDSGLGDAC